MKRIISLFLTFLILTVSVVYASPVDYVMGFIGTVGWQAAAGILSALLLIGGLAARAVWVSSIFVMVGAIFLAVGEGVHAIFTAVGGGFNWLGTILQDGKLSSDELKQAKPQFILLKNTIKDSWSTMVGLIKAAWASIKPAGTP